MALSLMQATAGRSDGVGPEYAAVDDHDRRTPKIKVQNKDEVAEQLGRSPDRVTWCWRPCGPSSCAGTPTWPSCRAVPTNTLSPLAGSGVPHAVGRAGRRDGPCRRKP
jgi:hypothetical protein